jgi:hypothetical protein
MPWETILYISIVGVAISLAVFTHVVRMGIRYKQELPKLPITRSIEELERVRDDLDAEISNLDDEKAEAVQIIDEAERRESSLEILGQQVEALQRDLLNLQAEEQKLIAVRKELEETGAKLEKASASLSSMRLESEQIKRHLEVDRKEVENLNGLKQELAKLEQRLPTLRAERDDLKIQLDNLRSEVNGLAEKLEPLRKDHAELTGEVQAKTAERKELIETIESLKKNYAEAGGFGKDHDPCEDLWEPYFSEKKKVSTASSEQQKLSDMGGVLKGAGIQLPHRTLLAFHTALKIQDISPLTVLAGISGTGKSLLPRLYAKCMGINFLNLPVQPGWNSPQDLFGFYNYIEQKYKATPLAQAMVQFDQFNRANWGLPSGATDLTEQVLLVLLDEMNLARVEYYFSELLSRLELRRSIDPYSQADRQKVEVPLQIGHGFRGLSSVSLYPGENVLFAGTMNEDESAMSLSDKVLDRASVLRFGKPHELQTSQPDMDKITDSGALTLGTWKSWHSRVAVRPEMEDILKKLSGVMAAADSPFGHRVGQGIMSYLSLYPDSSPLGQKHAMADQIEQKILPKLRGKDIGQFESQIKQLQEIVTGLDDHQLSQAIQQGLESEQGAFMWTGLDRAEE